MNTNTMELEAMSMCSARFVPYAGRITQEVFCAALSIGMEVAEHSLMELRERDGGSADSIEFALLDPAAPADRLPVERAAAVVCSILQGAAEEDYRAAQEHFLGALQGRYTPGYRIYNRTLYGVTVVVGGRHPLYELIKISSDVSAAIGAAFRRHVREFNVFCSLRPLGVEAWLDSRVLLR